MLYFFLTCYFHSLQVSFNLHSHPAASDGSPSGPGPSCSGVWSLPQTQAPRIVTGLLTLPGAGGRSTRARWVGPTAWTAHREQAVPQKQALVLLVVSFLLIFVIIGSELYLPLKNKMKKLGERTGVA